METITALPKVPDAILINKLLLEYGVLRAKANNEIIDTFVDASNKANLLIMEVFKGLIASHKV